MRVQLRADHNLTLSDDQMKTQILYTTEPDEYNIAKELLKHQLNVGVEVTIINIKSTYRQIYSSYVISHKQAKQIAGGRHNQETALYAKTKFTKKFKGDCCHCRRKGHKSPDYWERDQNKSKSPANWKSQHKSETALAATAKLQSYYCGKDNHTEYRCFKKKKDTGSDSTEYRCFKKKKDTGSDNHTEYRCFKKKKDTGSDSNQTALCVYETALIATAIKDGTLQDNTFIADIGASHMVNTKQYLMDIQPHEATISVGNDAKLQCTEIGTLNATLKDDQGMRIPLSLENFLYVPDLKVNLLSVTKCIS